jgi:hypothetical protein
MALQIFLPIQSDTFFDEVKELREIKKIYHDFWVTLVGDTITEEAYLPMNLGYGCRRNR